MSRFLSESLQAPEPLFRNGLQELERSHGHPSHDIRLSSEVNRQAKVKQHELGLDAHDTTAQELYHGLIARLKADDRKLTRALQTLAVTHVSLEADVVAGMQHVLTKFSLAGRSYALKNSRFKALMRKQPPKRTMKQLGYRSLDSLLKHEVPALIMAAAQQYESAAWQRSLSEQYRKLTSVDFETRATAVLYPRGKNWTTLARVAAEQTRHTVLGFPELGSVVLLPLAANAPAGSVTASLALAVAELNRLKSASTYLQLSQVRADFGVIVQQVASREPESQTRLLDQPVSWQLLQRYYARSREFFRQELFEPYLDVQDITWHSIEKVLTALVPSYSFWEHSAHVASLHEGKPVSLNIIDVAINACNHIPFEQRLSTHFQQSLWHELLLRYLQPDTVAQTILQELQPAYATEPALIN